MRTDATIRSESQSNGRLPKESSGGHEVTSRAEILGRTARRAGLFYLLVLILAPIHVFVIPAQFVVPGDATITAANIMENKLLYRAGIVVGLASCIFFLVVGLHLHSLLKHVDRLLSNTMLAFVCIGIAAGIVNFTNEIAPLVLLSGSDYFSAFTKPELDALVTTFLRLKNAGNHVSTMFWGLWLLPFGLLVLRSRMFPKLLGYLLLVGCVSYCLVSLCFILLPQYGPTVSQYLTPFYAIGELLMIFWLLFKGVNQPEEQAKPS